MYDNKVRLSQDVIEKAELIAAEWGLKNARAAIEAVFRRYSDDYLYGRKGTESSSANSGVVVLMPQPPNPPVAEQPNLCDALDVLDDLLAM